MADPLTRFLRTLYRVPHTERRFNPYRRRILRRNLRLYLQHMRQQRPTVLLIGEALGYRGGRLTGVPFSSEKLLIEGGTDLPLFGAAQGYQLPQARPSPGRLTSEQTATIVWETVAVLPTIIPLMWNAYPFHPHQPNRPQSNRPPTAAELTEGAPFLHDLLRLFDIQQLIAVGNKAAYSLTKLGLNHHKVRHPAHGGKNDFVRGIRSLLDQEVKADGRR